MILEGVVRFYVTAFCFLEISCQALPEPVTLVLEFLAGPYAIPTALALSLVVYWFKMGTTADRAASQRTVLRGLLAVIFAWALAALVGLAWRQGMGEMQFGDRIECWRGLPSACPAAAVGFALGATLWRHDWRRGLVACLLTGMWVVPQTLCGAGYPMDIVVGTLLGTSLGWLLGVMRLLDRLLGALVRLARRLMLA
jgi:hypothetical protein